DPLTLPANPDLAPVAENLVPDTRLRTALGAHELDVARVQRRLALDDAPLDLAAGIRFGVPLDHVHAFDDQAVLVRQHFQDAATLAAILPADDEYVVVLPQRRR